MKISEEPHKIIFEFTDNPDEYLNRVTRDQLVRILIYIANLYPDSVRYHNGCYWYEDVSIGIECDRLTLSHRRDDVPQDYILVKKSDMVKEVYRFISRLYE